MNFRHSIELKKNYFLNSTYKRNFYIYLDRVSKSTVTMEIQRNSDERSHILSLSACPEQKQEEEAGETKENLLHQISEDPCKRTDRIRIKP